MNLLQDVITYIRRILKTPSNAVITDNLIIDYINRFWLLDVQARMQLFDFKTTYQFQTQPNVDQYNMPLYSLQMEPGAQVIGMYPVYQGFLQPCSVNGVRVPLYTQWDQFFNQWPPYVQSNVGIAVGDGTVGPYTIQIPIGLGVTTEVNQQPSGILRGHVDMSGIIATGVNIDPPFGTTINMSIPYTSIIPQVYFTSLDANGNNIVVQDSGQLLIQDGMNFANFGLLMTNGTAPFGYSPLSGGYSTTLNTINYLTGTANVTFPVAVPAGQDINCQYAFFEPGQPRAMLWYNNVITLRNPPDIQYQVSLEAYFTPAAFLSTSQALQFAYMSEYIARGAARKILSDTGDWQQFNAYEPLFQEQEKLVWIRSQRQWTATRTDTIYSNTGFQSNYNQSSIGT
jgi:hypothetical protein